MTRRLTEQQNVTATSPALVPAPAPAPAAPEALPNTVFLPAFGISVRPKPSSSSATPAAQTTKKVFFTIIKADILIPGADDPIKDAALVVKDKTIAWVGAASSIPKEYTDSPHRSFSVPVAMPGLWDCHTHFAGISYRPEYVNYVGFFAEHPASMGARLSRGCWDALQRGYTSLRDLGGLGCEMAKAIDDPTVTTIVGPNVYGAGAAMSQTAGHGDIFPLPAGDVLLNMGVTQPTPGHTYGSSVTMLVDGVAECKRGVRLNIRRGARCIKLISSGGVMSRDDNPLYQQFGADELQAIVEEAGRQGRCVAAHAHGKPGILAAIRAGVKSIEHGSFIDDECAKLMREKDVVLVATRMAIEQLLSTGGEGLSPENWAKAKLVAEGHEKAYKTAIDHGVTIALGTDTEPGWNMAGELEYAVKMGLSNLEAIRAATANAPLTVGMQAPLTGQLKAGYEADILGVTENPAEDVKVLQNRENIKWVWKGGKLYKGPGVGPWGEEAN